MKMKKPSLVTTVTKHSITKPNWKIISGNILESNHINANFVTKHSQEHVTRKDMKNRGAEVSCLHQKSIESFWNITPSFKAKLK